MSMQWILDNWVTILLIGGFIGVHFFMHGRGGHGGGHGAKTRGDNGDHHHIDGSQIPRVKNSSEGVALTGELVADTSKNSDEETHMIER